MNRYVQPFPIGHPVRLTKKERSKGVPAEIINDEIIGSMRIVKYKTGIGTGVAKFNINTLKGEVLYHKFLKLFERGKTNGKSKTRCI